jgi:hypothetical protein
MYASLLFWEEAHRGWILGAIGFCLWLATYYIYLRYDIRQYIRRRQPTRWSVDMATRTITAGRKPIE